MNAYKIDRNRRALITGLSVVVLTVAVRLVVMPYVARLRALQAEAATEAQRLQSERDLIARARSFPAEVENAINRADTADAHLLVGSTPGAAAASLAQLIDSIAERSGVLPTKVDAHPVSYVRDGVLAVPMSIEGESDLRGTLEFLLGIERANPITQIRTLLVDRPSRSLRTADKQDAGALAFRVTVVSYAGAASAGGRSK